MLKTLGEATIDSHFRGVVGGSLQNTASDLLGKGGEEFMARMFTPFKQEAVHTTLVETVTVAPRLEVELDKVQQVKG